MPIPCSLLKWDTQIKILERFSEGMWKSRLAFVQNRKCGCKNLMFFDPHKCSYPYRLCTCRLEGLG